MSFRGLGSWKSLFLNFYKVIKMNISYLNTIKITSIPGRVWLTEDLERGCGQEMK